MIRIVALVLGGIGLIFLISGAMVISTRFVGGEGGYYDPRTQPELHGREAVDYGIQELAIGGMLALAAAVMYWYDSRTGQSD